MAARTIVDALADVIATMAGPYDLRSALTAVCRDACAVLPATSATIELTEFEPVSVTARPAGDGRTDSRPAEPDPRDGDASVAIRIQVGGTTTGSLVLRRSSSHRFEDDEREVACILGEAIAAMVVVDRQREEHLEQVRQLQHALDSRVVIEQAKGVLAARLGLPLHEAFELLRARARDHNLRLADVAQRVVASQDDDQPASRRPG